MKPSTYSTLVATAIGSALSFSVHAEVPARESALRQPTVEVTASRHPQALDESLASVTVITREDIERSQAPDLIDLLSRQVGVDVSRTGGPGQASTVFLRGTNSNHSLVLIDGVRVASTGQGLFDFAHLPIEQIERIEIVRGPRAALWGSDAIGGVIHIFTREPQGLSASAVGGSYGRWGASAGWGTSGERGGFGATAGYEDLRGFSATSPDNFSFDPDDDGYRNRNLSLRGSTALGTQTLGFSALATDAEVEFDQGVSDVDNASGGLTLGGKLIGRWSHTLTLGYARENLDTPAFGSRFESRRTSLDWVNALALTSDQRLSFGLNWYDESGESLSAFAGVVFDRSRDNAAGFLAYHADFGRQELELAARYDDNSQFGDATTGNAAWGWRWTEDARLRLSWGEGFRAPNFNELYHPGFGGLFAGNPALRPEQSESAEAGLEVTIGDGQRLGVSAYRTRVRDLIAFDGPDFQAINIDRVRIDGVELEYRYTLGGWDLGANATWQDPEDESTGLTLLRRPERKLRASVGYRFEAGLDLALDGEYASERRDFGADLPAYALAHLRLGWDLAPAWRLEARVENLFDRDYQLAAGYNTPGRSGLLTLRYATP